MSYSSENLPEAIVIETERIVFYPVTIEHLNDIAIFLGDHQVRSAMKMPTLDTREKQLNWFNRFEKERNEGRVLQWTGYSKDDGSYTSLLTLKDIIWPDKRAELGYSVNPSKWRHGFGVETAGKGLRFAFETLDLHTVIAQVSPTNQGSLKVVGNLGFEKEGHFKERIYYDDSYYDLLQFVKINPKHRSN